MANTTTAGAAYCASNAHSGQVRDYTGEPYITHPLRVARFLEDTFPGPRTGVPADVISVALLHDVLEDTDVTGYQLEKRFGLTIVQAVDNLTARSDAQIILDAERTWAAKLSAIPLLVKIADRVDNLRSLNHDGEFAGPRFYSIALAATGRHGRWSRMLARSKVLFDAIDLCPPTVGLDWLWLQNIKESISKEREMADVAANLKAKMEELNQ